MLIIEFINPYSFTLFGKLILPISLIIILCIVLQKVYQPKLFILVCSLKYLLLHS
jgi:hypothetical protein